MGAEVVVIGEILVSILSIFFLRLKAAGLSDEECNKLIEEALIQVRATKPEDLPDV